MTTLPDLEPAGLEAAPKGYLFELCYSHEHDRWSGPMYSECLPDAADVRNVVPLYAARSAPEAGKAVVRPLEWRQNSQSIENSLWANVETIGRSYTIDPESHVFRVETQLTLSEYGPDALGLHPTLDAAKAAAQADFASRVLPLLASAPAPQAVPAEEIARRECPIGIKPDAAQFCSAGTCVHCALHRSEAEATSLRRKLEEARSLAEQAEHCVIGYAAKANIEAAMHRLAERASSVLATLSGASK